MGVSRKERGTEWLTMKIAWGHQYDDSKTLLKRAMKD